MTDLCGQCEKELNKSEKDGLLCTACWLQSVPFKYRKSMTLYLKTGYMILQDGSVVDMRDKN